MEALCERAVGCATASRHHATTRKSNSVWRLCRRAVAQLCLCLCMLVPVGLFIWFMPLLAGMLNELRPVGAVPDRLTALAARVCALEAARKSADLQAVDFREPSVMPAGIKEARRSASGPDTGQER